MKGRRARGRSNGISGADIFSKRLLELFHLGALRNPARAYSRHSRFLFFPAQKWSCYRYIHFPVSQLKTTSSFSSFSMLYPWEVNQSMNKSRPLSIFTSAL